MIRIPVCFSCKHYDFENKYTCEAFPDGIKFNLSEKRRDENECASGIHFEERTDWDVSSIQKDICNKVTDWYDVEDVLYDGTKEEIESLCCPDCGAKISYRFSNEPRGFEVRCKTCGYIERGVGGNIPNCVTFFGEKHSF